MIRRRSRKIKRKGDIIQKKQKEWRVQGERMIPCKSNTYEDKPHGGSPNIYRGLGHDISLSMISPGLSIFKLLQPHFTPDLRPRQRWVSQYSTYPTPTTTLWVKPCWTQQFDMAFSTWAARAPSSRPRMYRGHSLWYQSRVSSIKRGRERKKLTSKPVPRVLRIS